VYTPGHTSDHASVMVACRVEGLQARILIAGEAVISHSYFVLGKVWRHNADFLSTEAALAGCVKNIAARKSFTFAAKTPAPAGCGPTFRTKHWAVKTVPPTLGYKCLFLTQPAREHEANR